MITISTRQLIELVEAAGLCDHQVDPEYRGPYPTYLEVGCLAVWDHTRSGAAAGRIITAARRIMDPDAAEEFTQTIYAGGAAYWPNVLLDDPAEWVQAAKDRSWVGA